MAKRILVPYDVSEQADFALEHALGAFESAEVVLLHVIEPFADHTGAGGYDGTLYKQQLENAEEMLANVRDRYDEADRIDTVVHYGRPVHRIIRTINEDGFDHVVIGSHGRDGAARLLLGSVAEAVARRSPVPVTVVREPPRGEEPPADILVPFDASTMSKRALEYALDQFEDGAVTVLYVAYPEENGGRRMDTVFEILEDWDEERADHIQSVLLTAEEIAEERGRTVETTNTDGTPAEAIVEFAREGEFDHIVVGSTGRDGISRLLLGSVAETVVRRAPVSVTVAK